MALNNRGGFLPGTRRSRLGVVALALVAMLATMPGSVAARSGGPETINVAWTPAGFTFAASRAFVDSGVVNVTHFGCPQLIPQTPLANCLPFATSALASRASRSEAAGAAGPPAAFAGAAARAPGTAAKP